ncbi:MAG: AAA family ATPase [Proteobacteria bacterium]|nr:ATP-dependent helicase [Desulfobacula sp.]MBU4129702.1 AAA family ATPase [Pseudomonadota bacterium]
MIQITQEQKKIVGHDLLPGEILKIMAFAGTGKTTTLVEYTKKRPHLRFLYIAFNKSVQVEAAQKFPGNVTARTTHSLAFQAKGFKYRDRLVKGFRASQVLAALKLDKYEDAKYTMDTLHNYLASADPKISSAHIPAMARGFYKKNKRSMPALVDHANYLGRKMCDGSCDGIGMIHDGYLKLYQLSNPRLPYDCILLDEAQDITPVTASLVFAQARPLGTRNPAAIILVGDGHQQIYGFRGAKDTLKSFSAARTLHLTQSFRFDNNVARVANMVLETFKQESRRIRGTPVLVKPPWDPEHHTIIARTNATLFDRAVRLYKGHRIGFVGGAGSYRLDILKDVYSLYKEDHAGIRDPYIKSFAGFGSLKSYARTVEDFELSSVCKMVEKYTGSIPTHVDNIMARAEEQDTAGILLTTAHKSKGLEWANVLLMADFHPLMKEGKPMDPEGVDPDEFNLIYVAMTRAMVNLRFDRESDIPEFIRVRQKKHRPEKHKGS